MRETEKIWMNGELVDWADAKVHVGVHGLHYGTGVFEGIRAYETPKGTAVFRLTDHLERLENSAKLLYMQLPYSTRELKEACWELIGVNGLPECYLRPLAFYGYGELGVATTGNPVDVVIMSWPWGTYLGDEGLKNGIRAKISSWQRIGPNVIPHTSKATGVYLNSMLAVTEANRAGYDEAILLTGEGYVADGSGETVFMVKDGLIATPDLSTSILQGITRNTVIQIAQDLGYTVLEKNLIRSDLLLADEVFMVGTAAEVTPVRSIDDVEIGVGPVTLELQKQYLDTVRGRTERWSHWLEYAVPSPAASANCFLYEGATPVFADVDPRTLNLEPAAVEAAITERTRALVAVDIFGYPCELDPLRELCERHGLALVEDACEALGAEYLGRTIGSHGPSAVFAFYANKQMTTGEGGVVTTHSEEEWRLLKSLRNQGLAYGEGPGFNHVPVGFNYRWTDIQAAIGIAQLEKLDEILRRRAEVAARYTEMLASVDRVETLEPDDADHIRSWFVYV